MSQSNALSEFTKMIMLNRHLGDQPSADNDPQFVIGQVVRHRRYGYRGVIVDFDMKCQAGEAWYQKNQTQPARNQPWYHVLVDTTENATYAAESSLMDDDSGDLIRHPLLNTFFDDFIHGQYVRNDTPWPS